MELACLGVLPSTRISLMPSLPPDVLDVLQPSAGDRLGVLTGAADVLREASFVQLDLGAVERLAARWADESWPENSAFPEMHYFDGTERTLNWLLLLDALNFCFWAFPGEARWRVEWRDETLDGYNALAAALSRAIEDGQPLHDADYLAALDEKTLAEILRPAPDATPIPLFAERLANAREVGRVLQGRYDGQFANALAAAERDATNLALLLARDFPSFADVATWNGQRIPFLKRAQICVADVFTAFGGMGLGALTGLDGLTAFADYKLPQLLRYQGVMVYTPELAAQVDAYQEIAVGSQPEVEIRAATVWAVELIRRALAGHGVIRPASEIDYRLWSESQTPTPDMRPYHRTRTIYY
jgi:putative queuosine salvage protein